MDSWQKDLIAKRDAEETKLANIKEEQTAFLAQTHVPSTQKELLCIEAMKTMYEMLVITVEQSLTHIDEELRRLNKLVAFRSGSDSTFDE